jgi:hypothetical protein
MRYILTITGRFFCNFVTVLITICSIIHSGSLTFGLETADRAASLHPLPKKSMQAELSVRDLRRPFHCSRPTQSEEWVIPLFVMSTWFYSWLLVQPHAEVRDTDADSERHVMRYYMAAFKQFSPKQCNFSTQSGVNVRPKSTILTIDHCYVLFVQYYNWIHHRHDCCECNIFTHRASVERAQLLLAFIQSVSPIFVGRFLDRMLRHASTY